MKLSLSYAIAGVLATLVIGSGAARAQDSSKYYTVMHPEQFKINWGAVYKEAEKRTADTRAELPHFLDLAYGPNVKEKLDLYLPKNKPKHAPVFVFLHGGGFREGDRAQYGYIASSFAQHGIITAVASYRLTGDGFKFPDQPNDTRMAVRWLYKNVAKYDGNPHRLYVGGHSAGCVLSSEIGVDRAWMTQMHVPKDVIRGIAPVSCGFDLRKPGRPGEGDVFVPTPELQEQASAILHIVDPVPVAVVAVGGAETPIIQPATDFVDKLKAANVKATLVIPEGMDHKDTVNSLADDQSEEFKAILAMIEATP